MGSKVNNTQLYKSLAGEISLYTLNEWNGLWAAS